MSEFIRTKFDSLDGKTVVAFTTPDDSFSIKADKASLRIEGKLVFESAEDVQEYFHKMGAAWTEHLKLKPKLVNTLSGH